MTTLEKVHCGNHLLRRLPDIEFALLAPRLNRIGLQHRHMLAPAGQPMEQVYFLESGIASVVMTSANADPTEVGIIGREGFSGIPVLLRTGRSPHDIYMQVDGSSALAISPASLREALVQSPPLEDLLLHYVQAFMAQTAASAVANAHLRVEARLARWLLMCHDRVDGDDVRLTHEFISMMIATQRTRVTMTLHVLEGAGAILSTRGRVKIVDRQKLESIAGDGYGHPETEYRRVIGPFGRSASWSHP
jgi:CRP-like cAMP-binding protein